MVHHQQWFLLITCQQPLLFPSLHTKKYTNSIIDTIEKVYSVQIIFDAISVHPAQIVRPQSDQSQPAARIRLHAKRQSGQLEAAVRVRLCTAYDMPLHANGLTHQTIFGGTIRRVHYQTQSWQDEVIMNLLINYVLIKINKFYFPTKCHLN